MGIVLRTIIITLILCVGYYFYVSLNDTSYKNLNIPNEEVVQPKEEKRSEEEVKKEEPKVAKIKICFLNSANDYKYVNRTAQDEGIETAISLLLEGPNAKEKADGLFSEIPPKTKLYWVKEKDGNLIVNLSSGFAQGGGTTSVMARIDQLVRTVKIYSPDAPVYLYIEGKKAEYIGGDGVFLKQPLN